MRSSEMAVLERGFKAWSERTSAALRGELRVGLHDPIDPPTLARLLGIVLWTPEDVPELPKDALRQLLEVDPDGWSAVSLVRKGEPLVIYNHRHSAGRQATDITHELAHFLLEHKPSKMILSADGELVLRSHDAKQEAEADWLAGAILLPRDAILRCKRLGWNEPQIADHFGASKKLVTYRVQITGVKSQVRAAQRFRVGKVASRSKG